MWVDFFASLSGCTLLSLPRCTEVIFPALWDKFKQVVLHVEHWEAGKPGPAGEKENATRPASSPVHFKDELARELEAQFQV